MEPAKDVKQQQKQQQEKQRKQLQHFGHKTPSALGLARSEDSNDSAAKQIAAFKTSVQVSPRYFSPFVLTLLGT